MLDKKGGVQSILEFRGSLLELLVVAVAIGFSISLFAGAVGPIIGIAWSTIISIGLLVFACLILLARLVPKANRRLSLEGAILITTEGNIVPIDRYPFSENISQYFRALFLENKALEQTWKKSSKHTLFPKSVISSSNKEQIAESAAAKKLVREAVEYFVLDRLSKTLMGYFDRNPQIDEQQIITLQRNDIPSVLLSNRFLDLLSRPMEEREPFLTFKNGKDSDKPREDSQSKIVAAFTGEGAIFDNFELSLPRGSAVSRGGDHSLIIDTKRFAIRFDIEFDGWGFILPSNFDELYLNTKRADRAKRYKVEIIVDVKIKWSAILSQTGWQYFRWIDRFLEVLMTEFSFAHFLDEIGWKTANSVVLMTRHSQSKVSRTKTRKTE